MLLFIGDRKGGPYFRELPMQLAHVEPRQRRLRGTHGPAQPRPGSEINMHRAKHGKTRQMELRIGHMPRAMKLQVRRSGWKWVYSILPHRYATTLRSNVGCRGRDYQQTLLLPLLLLI